MNGAGLVTTLKEEGMVEGEEASGESPDTPGSALSRRRSRQEDLAVYQEDDTTFKNRLKEILVDHTLLNSAATLSVCIIVFYVITEQLFIGIVAGLLVLIVSNMSNALWKIREFERWEIFSNGVKLGCDPKGKIKFVRFADIRDISVMKGFRGEVLVIDLGDRKIRYPLNQNKDMFALLQHKFNAFQKIQKSPDPES
jgi:hypothetical protein